MTNKPASSGKRTAEQERAEIVKWLKRQSITCDCMAWDEGECACGAWDDYKTVSYKELAQSIQRGDHLKGKK